MKIFRATAIFMSAVFICAAVGTLGAAENKSDESPAALGLFEAMNQGLVDAKLTAKNSLECSVAMKNLTEKPLLIDMPSAFAGVPVLAQGGFPMGGMGMGGGAMGGGGGAMGGGGMASRSGSRGGGGQSVGGSSGRRGGSFLIQPERTVRHQVRTVCLEHGKTEPNAQMDYELIPIESYTDNNTTRVLCEMLGDEQVNQQAVQAAVWHHENGLSYEELSEKIYRPAQRQPRPWFSNEELQMSRELLSAASEKAKTLDERDAALHKTQLRAEEEALVSENSEYQASYQLAEEPVQSSPAVRQIPADEDTAIEDLTKKLQ